MSSIIGIFALIVSLIAVYINYKSSNNNKVSMLIELESTIYQLKSNVNRQIVNMELADTDKTKNKKQRRALICIYKSAYEEAKENWYSAIDRLSFLILYNYLHKKEFKRDYNRPLPPELAL